MTHLADGSTRQIAPSIRAIDVHVHLRDSETVRRRVAMVSSIGRYFGQGAEPRVVPVDELADMYRANQMMAVVVNTTDAVATGESGVPNDHIAEVVRAHPDVFFGFGIVDPAIGRLAEREVERCATELGLMGIGELNPGRQHFLPNDAALSSLWHRVADLGLVTLFHSGYAAAGSGTPGGLGVRLRYNQPILLDDLAADCPGLRIICAHPGWPWESEALAVARHKANVYLDLSGVAPKYLSAEVRTHVEKLINKKVLFGSDWPVLTPQRWLDEFHELGMRSEVKEQILLTNAMDALGLTFRSEKGATE